MLEASTSQASSSKHRRKVTAENWDDDFEFAFPPKSTTTRPPTSAQTSHRTRHRSRISATQLDQHAGESRANAGSKGEASEHIQAQKVPEAGTSRRSKAFNDDWLGEEDDARRVGGGRISQEGLDEQFLSHEQFMSKGPGMDPSGRRVSLQYRRLSRPPPSISILPHGVAPPRLSPSSTSTRLHDAVTFHRGITAGTLVVTSNSIKQSQSVTTHQVEAESVASIGVVPANQGRSAKRHPSASAFLPQPAASAIPPNNESSFALSSWSQTNRSSPNLRPHAPQLLPGTSSVAEDVDIKKARKSPARGLSHMKSAEMMPPPPLPSRMTSIEGSGLGSVGDIVRRKSWKGKQCQVRESQLPFSPSQEQLTGSEDGKKERGFWKRLSGSAAGLRGSPTQLSFPDTSHRRRRSSSSASPSKHQTRLSSLPSQHPPLPPLPHNLRSPSAASSNSAISNQSALSVVSAISVSGNISKPLPSRPSGLTGILRRSTSSLVKKDQVGGSTAPPSPYKSHPVMTGASNESIERSPVTSSQDPSWGPSRSASQQSFSRGFHLPSPSPGSPYKKGSYFLADPIAASDIPPLPRSASLRSPASVRDQEASHGLPVPAFDLGTEEERAEDDSSTQATPKRPTPTGPVGQGFLICDSAPQEKAVGWGGDDWTGFPNNSKPVSLASTPARTQSPQALADPSPSSTISRQSSRLSQAAFAHDSSFDVDHTISKSTTTSSFATLRRLTDLSRKHNRKISDTFNFGTSGSHSSQEGGTVRRSRLEKVVASPMKPEPGANVPMDGLPTTATANTYLQNMATRKVTAESSRPRGEKEDSPEEDWDLDMGLESSTQDRSSRGESVSAPNSVLKPTMHSPDTPWIRPSSISAFGLGSAASTEVAKRAKERRRQSWNDFVIPRGVLEKQRDLKRGIEGVKRFAGGVEALKLLLDQRAAVADHAENPIDTAALIDLDAEFEQWWEMATVLIEVGSTDQAGTASASTSPNPESPKRARRITLASDDARRAADIMRRSQSQISDSHQPRNRTPRAAGFLPRSATGSKSLLDEGIEPTKTSLPDPSQVAAQDTLSSPPRASPDIWRASTGRQDLSKRQLEVLRTMLRTPVSDPSVPGRSDLVRGLSTISASSTTSSIDRSAAYRGGRSIKHAFRPSISRVSTTDASYAYIRSPDYQAEPKGSESFPSPNDSAYIVPSQSFPSPLTASALALGRGRYPVMQSSGEGGVKRLEVADEGSKMRKGSKVGLAGLREFLKGLKGKESKRDLTQRHLSIQMNPREGITQGVNRGYGATGQPIQSQRSRTPRQAETTITPASPSVSRPPVTQHKSKLQHGHDSKSTPRPEPLPRQDASALGTPGLSHQPPSTSIIRAASGSSAISRQPSRNPSLDRPSDPVQLPRIGTISATPGVVPTLGPPVSGKERRRPGLRGIFRAGSGSWSDLINGGSGGKDGRRSSREITLSSPTTSYYPSITSPTESSFEKEQSGSRIPSNQSRNFAVPDKTQARSSQAADNHTVEPGLVNAGEMTLRPRKSRTLGLGWPDETARPQGPSPSEGSGSSMPSAVPRRTSSRHFSQEDGIDPRLESASDHREDISSHHRLTSDTGMIHWREALRAGDAVPDMVIPNTEEADDGEPISLTPESLPVLLDYLQQCQSKLEDWRERVRRLPIGNSGL